MKLADFANWRWISTMLIWTAILGLGGVVVTGWGLYWEIYTPETGMKDSFASHLEVSENAIQKASDERKILDDKLGRILDYLEKDYYIDGTGSVGTFGGDESYVRVNRRSRAAIYKDGDRIRITCSDVEGKPEAILRVNGTFSNSNQDLLISFSRAAADDLGIAGRVEVELEPVEGEQ